MYEQNRILNNIYFQEIGKKNCNFQKNKKFLDEEKTSTISHIFFPTQRSSVNLCTVQKVYVFTFSIFIFKCRQIFKSDQKREKLRSHT